MACFVMDVLEPEPMDSNRLNCVIEWNTKMREMKFCSKVRLHGDVVGWTSRQHRKKEVRCVDLGMSSALEAHFDDIFSPKKNLTTFVAGEFHN